MGKIIYSIMTSLDGYIEDVDKSIDWITIDEELHRFVNERVRAGSAFLFGRRMYTMMEDYWPTADADPTNPDYIIDYSKIYKSKPKVVFSKTLRQVEGDARIVRDAISEEAVRLKEQYPGDLMVSGPHLAATFIRLGLIEEYQLYVNPIILGGGTPMFPPLNSPIRLHLAETRSFKSGVSFLRYLKAGAD